MFFGVSVVIGTIKKEGKTRKSPKQSDGFFGKRGRRFSAEKPQPVKTTIGLLKEPAFESLFFFSPTKKHRTKVEGESLVLL